jgi:hypothetical protein
LLAAGRRRFGPPAAGAVHQLFREWTFQPGPVQPLLPVGALSALGGVGYK